MSRVVTLSKKWQERLKMPQKVYYGEVDAKMHSYKQHMVTSSDAEIAAHNAAIEAKKRAKRAKL